MRHEARSTCARQCPGVFGAAAGEAPAQGLFLLQGRHDEIRRSEEVPHPSDHCRTLVQTIRRSWRGGIRATRVRHVHLAPHGAPVHAEDGLHLSVSGEGRKGAEPGFREEMAGNGLPRHKEGGRGKRFGDMLGGRIVGSDLRNNGKGPRRMPRPSFRVGRRTD